MVKDVPVCKATLEDISKTLRIKEQLSTVQAGLRLPGPIRDFVHLFADDSGAENLASSRGNLITP